MKLIRVFSLVTLLLLASPLWAQSSTTDVSAYLATHFKVEYIPVSDDMMACPKGAPAPGSRENYFHCYFSEKNGVYVGIGAKDKSYERDKFHRVFAGMIKFAANVGNKLDNSKDMVVCQPEDFKTGQLVNCKVEYHRASIGFQVLHFSVFYLKSETPFETIIVSADNFHRTPEVPKAKVLEYQSRMRPLPH